MSKKYSQAAKGKQMKVFTRVRAQYIKLGRAGLAHDDMLVGHGRLFMDNRRNHMLPSWT